MTDYEAAIDSFIEDYEMLGESADGRDASYTPNDNDRALLKDAIMGLLADDAFVTAWSQRATQPQEPVRAAPEAAGLTPADALASILTAIDLGQEISRDNIEKFRATLTARPVAAPEAAVLKLAQGMFEPTDGLAKNDAAGYHWRKGWNAALRRLMDYVNGEAIASTLPASAGAGSQPVALPAGWVIVPDSATHNMLNAANAGRKKGRSSSGDIYRAMIEAAPKFVQSNNAKE